MIRHPRQALTIRAALVLGFGVTLSVWLLSGLDFTNRVAGLQQKSTAINERYMRAQELLSTLRAQTLLGSVYVRDALLDPNPGATADYRRQVEETFHLADQALARYVPIVDSAVERPRIDKLRNEIASFRTTLLEVLASDSTRWPGEARTLLRARIVPRRDGVIRVSEEVQALNRSTLLGQQADTGLVYQVMQRRNLTQLGLALAASCAIGLFATRHVSKLEHKLREVIATNAQNTTDLQRLSAQIITTQEEERRNIARELHDEVGQVLTAIKVELAVAQRGMESAGLSPHLLSGARSLTDGALHTVRDLSQLLRPAVLDDLGLSAAIGSHLREVSRRHGIAVELLHDQIHERWAADIEAAAYRIVQEALTNVARHAHASSCRVYLQRLAHTILITVEDDGIGFDASGDAAGSRGGLGLIGIRERVAQLGGTVRLETTPGKGTRLTVELPARLRPSPPGSDAGEPDVASAELANGEPTRQARMC
jgi:signal transduction histidine kinase